MVNQESLLEAGAPDSNPLQKNDLPATRRTSARMDWLWDVLLIGILLVGAFLRFVGLDWDQNQHLHPDERFLTMVETAIEPVDTFQQYFDTRVSTLNPNNRGYGFYVYGTLPLFMVRYAGEWLGRTGYDEIHLVGRQVSALMDLGTVFVVYLIALRLYRNRRLALLAAAFAALSVLPIQLSHYFTVDTFTNFFGMLAIFFAVCLLPVGQETGPESVRFRDSRTDWLVREWRTALLYVLFGAALGLAMASKINAVLLAVLLPGAAVLQFINRPAGERERWIGIYLRNLAVAGLVAFIVFRIFQPYAFSGPGFLGIIPNAQWVDSLRALASQSTGDVDFPPALQWARRPIWFALQNMLLWGLGLPLGILAWVGFFWMGFRILKGEWRSHFLIWSWTGLYFAYQSINWTRSMRYQMLVYPTLAIIAAWAVWAIWEHSRSVRPGRGGWWQAASLVVGLGVLVLTLAWAYAFTQIYTRPVTRVEASAWIYQNVPGPINLHIDDGDKVTNQPVAYRSGYTLRSDEQPLILAFRPQKQGELIDLRFEHLVSRDADQMFKTLSIVVSDSPDTNTLAFTQLADVFVADGDPRGKSYSVNFNDTVMLDPSRTYYLTLDFQGKGYSLDMAGPVMISFDDGQERIVQSLPEPVEALRAGSRYQITVEANETGLLREVLLAHLVDWEGRPETKKVRLSILDADNGDKLLASSEIQSQFAAQKDPRGEEFTFQFTTPVEVQSGQRLIVQVEHVDGPGALAIYGSKQANESSWDDALPVSLYGYNPYDYSYGIYRSDLNFEMYWDDNLEKLERFLTNLDQADTIFISSNRQWGTTTRVPERYPLTSEYYRRLLGCPVDKEIAWCYSVAEPGMFAGDLGFELAAVFQSDPNLGSLRFNTQFAEEAFTVYDHPKVLIFKKTTAYDPGQVKTILRAVDLSTVVHLTPRKASSNPGNLLLPTDRLTQQQSGGTWTQLFNAQSPVNRSPALAAVVWYGAISVLGWLVYPFTRMALRGLPDHGYPMARLVGMLLLAYPVWLLGSYRVSSSPLTISIVFLGLIAVNAILAIKQRTSILEELRRNWRYYLVVEALMLAFFVLFVLVRLGNPDLWHPWKGGEKPMDFSYFNAVLKSATFPPYDPWFAGGYINYYYYGFVLIGVPVKWLGIAPVLAYNLILPTLFALLALGAFSTGWNLLSSTCPRPTRAQMLPEFNGTDLSGQNAPWLAGISSAVAMVILGNWGTVRMIWHGLQRLANMQVPFESAPFFLRIAWTFEGLWRLVSVPGTRLPFGTGDWYWIPSRAIPGEPITEFPAFTFLYADLHAHMIAWPVTLLALSWALSILLGRWSWKSWGQLGASFLLGALAIGTLRPTNTWDWPTFLLLGCLAVLYAALRYGAGSQLRLPWLEGAGLEKSPAAKSIFFAGLGIILLVGLSAVFYQPFSSWYGQAYNQIDPWAGTHTPFWSYLTHWGVFLFVFVSWMVSETIDWMASTPVSALNRLRRVREPILLGLVFLLAIIVGLLILGVEIAWLALPLAAWAGILILRTGQADAKRAVLFMIGTGLVLTLFVEVAVLRGDIGRMNTVFKFYLQVWTLFALSAGAALFWLFPRVEQTGQIALCRAWKVVLIFLVGGAAMYPLMAGMDKINDRVAKNAPHTLDGMVYMDYATYAEGETEMDLSEDYRAIHWVQENIPGSPVIVEANVPEYRWGNRFTIYTGLPGVVGWNWHQRQQRATTPGEWVFKRVDEINQFYNTIQESEARTFLQRYRVRYIIVGQLERAVYSAEGLDKFTRLNGSLWQQIYLDGQTAVYKVIQ